LVKADTGGPSILGFMKLARVKTEEFTDIPAEPLVPANQVGEQSFVLSARAVRSAAAHARAPGIADAMAGVTFDFVPGGGVKLHWPKESDPMIRALTDGQLGVGDTVLSVEGLALNSRTSLWEAYGRFKDAREATAVVRNAAGRVSTIRLSNPLVQHQ
jgi:hypothetical protein